MTLFYDMAVVVSGGLLVGTLLALGVVPALFAIFFGAEKNPKPPGTPVRA